MARNCPDCSTQMLVETVHGVQLDACPQCAAIWFDAEELRTLLAKDPLAPLEIEDKNKPQAVLRPAGPSTHQCPDCKQPLQQYHYLYNSPIVLHACANCGGFLVEDGQLGQIQQWLDRSHEPLTADQEAKLTLAQATIEHDAFMQRQENLRRF